MIDRKCEIWYGVLAPKIGYHVNWCPDGTQCGCLFGLGSSWPASGYGKMSTASIVYNR